MADEGYGFPSFCHSPHEPYHGWVAAHTIGRVPTGDHHAVELRRRDLVHAHVGLYGVAVFALINLACPGPYHLHLCTFLAQTEQRVPQLQVLVQILRQYRHAHALELHGQHLLLAQYTARDAAGLGRRLLPVHSRSEEWVGYGLVVAAAVLWGSIGIAVRLISAAGIGVLEASTWRAGLAFAGALLASILTHRGRLRVAFRDVLLFAVYGFVSIALFFLAYFTAIQLTTLATAAILLYTAPLWVTILSAVLFGEDLSSRKLVALAAALVGCALVVRAYDPMALQLNLPGVLAGLASGLTYGLYSVFAKAALRRHPPLVVLTYALGFGTVFLAVGGMALGLPLTRLGPSHVAPVLPGVLYLGLVATCVAHWLYVAGLRRVQASRASIVATVEPVVASILGYVWFGEVLDTPQLAGGMLVLAAAASVQLRK